MLSALLDHLWQSTLLALAIALLVLALRKAPAAVRHALWLTASVKFVAPFAALAALGRLLAPPDLVPPPAIPAKVLIEKAAEPLARFPLQPSPSLLQVPHSPAEAGPLVTQAPHQLPLHLDPVLILLTFWALGSAAVLLRWMIRSVRVHRMVRRARPIAWPAPMPVVASPSPIGPGLVGLWRPVLVMPQSLPENLTRSEIDAIVAHEACHLRRRDNLTAALHAAIEAALWFHPLVWWIGTRLIAERELACDEAVLRAGHDRKAYARSLLESARLYVQSPLSCVAGASGVDLKTRVERIMTAPIASPLSRTKKALLLAAASFALATPVAAGLLTPQGRQAVAPFAKAVAVLSAPARALSLDQAESAVDASRPVVLGRNDAVLGARLAVAANDASPLSLAQTIAAPRLEQSPAPLPRPLEVAAAGPPAVQAVRAPAPADPAEAAASFVQTYAAATAKGAIARWVRPICVRVVGLPDDQAASVKARIETVAESVGAKTGSGACVPNVQVDFTADAQETLDSLFKAGGEALSDPTSGTQSVRTMTVPIQAWYLTNGKDFAANDTGDLKAMADYRPRGSAGLLLPVLYQGYPYPGDPTASSNIGISNSGPAYDGMISGPPNSGAWERSDPYAMDRSRQFSNVFVVVDAKRIPHATLGPVSDYVAMLALSQPKSPGHCQALPSIVDLFASCPGNAAPERLTAADLAYLRALYGADHTIWAKGRSASEPDVTKAMASRLADARLASR